MRKHFLTVCLCAASFFIQAQDKTAQKYADTITKEDAFKRLSLLASDDFQGRETGKIGAKIAADYIKSQFVAFGLKAPVNNSYFQMLNLIEKSPLSRNMSINGKQLTFLKDYYTLPNDFNSTKVSYNDFVFVGYGIASNKYDDLSNLNLEGKVAIVLPGEPVVNGKSLITETEKMSEWTSSRSKKVNALTVKKPAAIIFLNPSIEKMSGYSDYFNKTSLILGKSQIEAIKPLIIYAGQNAIDNLLSSTKKNINQLTDSIIKTQKPTSISFNANLAIDYQTKYTPIEAKNVLGFLEGSDPILKKEIIVISAHYDHIGVGEDGDVFNGADDDGSGTTGVLEIAEAFSKAKKEGKGPKRSILFLTVVGEEKGLLGSEWYSENPVFPLANTITNLNIDMIGRVGNEYKGKADSANYIYVIGSEKLSSTLKTINENANSTYTNLVLDYKYDDPSDSNRFYYRSDHYNFAKHNIPIIFYFNGVHEDYHKKTDEVKKINFPLLTKRAQLVFYTAWDLANRNTKPKVDRENDMQN